MQKKAFLRKTEPRNEVEPPLDPVSRISQPLEETMPTEVLNHMFLRQDIAASSNHPSGWEKTPGYMCKARLTPAPNVDDDDDDAAWTQSMYAQNQRDMRKYSLNSESEWEKYQRTRQKMRVAAMKLLELESKESDVMTAREVMKHMKLKEKMAHVRQNFRPRRQAHRTNRQARRTHRKMTQQA